MEKLKICIDFDGVLNQYHGYDEDDLSIPQKGAKEFLSKLQEQYIVAIHTVREVEKVKEWLNKYDLPFDEVTNIKQHAIAYVDDRAIKFDGCFDDTWEEIENFKTYWE